PGVRRAALNHATPPRPPASPLPPLPHPHPPPTPTTTTTTNTICPGLCFGPQIPYSAPHQRRVAHDQREVTCLVGTRPYTSSIVCWKSPRSPRNSRNSMPC